MKKPTNRADMIQRLKRNIVDVDGLEQLDPAEINALVDRDAFACVRGLFSREEIDLALKNAREGFSAERDNPAIGEKPGVVMSNYQKIAIGGAGNHWDYRPRFMRTIYNPVWANDIYGMRDIFVKFAKFRNMLQGYPLDYAIDSVEDGLWTAARLQQYPQGGGNISRHRDVVISTVTTEAGVERFLQLLLLITTKGKDFEEGGAYIEVDGELIEFEEEFVGGDIILYDGRTMHGVSDIDPHLKPDLSTLCGRLVAIVSLYKDMSADEKAYVGYEETNIDAEQSAEI